LAEHERQPWLYPYRRDAQLGWHGEQVLRPLLPVSLANGDRGTPRLAGLVASGADLTLVSEVLAEQLGFDLEDNEGEGVHRVGIGVAKARYKTIDLRLHSPDAAETGYREWRSKIGFVETCWYSDGLVLLGSIGFLDHFAVSASRSAQAVAVEECGAFDERFGMVIAR
jgi:hypothetical protein